MSGRPAPPAAPAGGTLTERAVRSGAWLAAREAGGMLVRLAGVTLVVRAIGPASYGIYAGAAAFVAVATLTAQGGAEVFLIRRREEPLPDLYAETFTYLLVSSLAVTAASLALSLPAAHLVRAPRAFDVFRVLVLTVPLNVLWAPAQAVVERRFDFRRLGFIEVAGDVVLYAVAVPLAWEGLGPWCLVAGFTAWQAWLLGASLVASGLRPRLRWSSATARQLAGHGLTYAAKDWIDSVGALVVPVVVGASCGAAGVGLVSFAGRLVDTAAFAQRSSWRVGLVSMSNVEEPRRLQRGLEQGSLLQFLVLGVPIALLALSSRAVVPLLFGPQWAPAVVVTALVGLSALLRGPGDMQGTLLFSRGRNLAVSTGALVRQLVVVGAAAVLVPRLGIDGYGLATLGTLAGVAYTRRVVRREIVPFGYRRLVPFVVGLVPLVLVPTLPLPWSLALLAPAAGTLALPGPRRTVVDTWRLVSGALLRPAPPAAAAPPAA